MAIERISEKHIIKMIVKWKGLFFNSNIILLFCWFFQCLHQHGDISLGKKTPHNWYTIDPQKDIHIKGDLRGRVDFRNYWKVFADSIGNTTK